MSTYLLTWKPPNWLWKDLDENVARSAKNEIVERGWSCGKRQNIKVGDRVFLLRQGRELPGLIGSGWVSEGAYLGKHWDATRRRKGHKAWFVGVDWDVLLALENRLPREVLLNGLLDKNLVNAQGGGVLIDPNTAFLLEKRWAQHRNKPLSIPAVATATFEAWEGEPIEYTGYRHVRDRRLRDQAMDASKGVCAVCERDYSKLLDGMGTAVLQVHHLQQIGFRDTPTLTKATDLAVVCANCHQLIHIDRKKARPLNALKKLLKSE